MDVSLRHLEVFSRVARAGSFSAAARELHVAQSSPSRTVQLLERRAGARLLDRDTRNVRLTAAGRELLAVADEVLGCHGEAMERFARYLEGHGGVVTVATLPSAAAAVLPLVASGFLRANPDVQLRIHDGLAGAAERELERGTADLAISVFDDVPPELAARPLIHDRFEAVLPAAHPLAAGPAVSWEQLAAEPFVAIGSDSSVRRLTDAAFARAGVTVSNLVEAVSVATVGGMVAAGLGVTALPALVRSLLTSPGLVHLPVGDPPLERRLGVLWHAGRELPPAGRLLLDHLESVRGAAGPLPPGVRWD